MISITNQFTKYLTNTLARDFDLLSDVLNISNAEIDKNNNILTITTTQEHKLVQNDYVYLDGLFYKEPVNYIRKTKIKQNFLNKNVVEVNLKHDVNFQINATLFLTGFDNILLDNKKFQIIDYNIIGDNISLFGYVDNQVVDVDMQNTGFVCYKFYDDITIDTNSIQETDNYITSLENITGAYNGMKFVKEVIDDNTFTIELFKNNITIKPQYKDIYINNAKAKVNTKVYTIVDLTQESINNFIAQMNQNKEDCFILIKKNTSDVSQNLVSVASSVQQIGQGLTNFSAQTTNNYNVYCIYKTKRQALDSDREHYVLGYQQNEIFDLFESVFSKSVNNVFFNLDKNFGNDKINILYQSIFTGITSIERVNQVENGLFTMATGNFKVSRYISLYGTYQNNEIGIPIKRVENKIFNQKNESVINIVNEK